MAPQLIQIEADGLNAVNQQAHTMCREFNPVHVKQQDGSVTEHEPKLLMVFPAAEDPTPPLVFDPPPMAA